MCRVLLGKGLCRRAARVRGGNERSWVGRNRLVAVAAIIAALLAALVQITPATASVSFSGAWGWGVKVPSAVETCTTVCAPGIAGGGTGQLTGPSGVALDSTSSNVYVADTYNNRIEEFTSSGGFVQAWGWGVSDGAGKLETCTTSCQAGISGGGAGQLNSPFGLAVDNSSGDLYVADVNNNRIDRFSSSGGFVQAWGWGVSDGANTFETCTASCQAGISGSGAGQLSDPHGVAVDTASGSVYVADSTNNRIEQFSSSGSFVTAWGGFGRGAGQLSDPEGVAVNGTSGNVYVADTSNNRIDLFSSSGGFVQAWGWGVSDGANTFETCTSSCHQGILGGGAGQLDIPEAVALDATSGNVYVADTFNYRIGEFSSTGSFVRAWGWGVSDGTFKFETCTTSCRPGFHGGQPGQLDLPEGVAVDNSANVFVADSNNNRMDEFSPGSSFVLAWGWGVTDGHTGPQICTTSCQAGSPGGGAGQLDYPEGVAVDSSNNVFVADFTNDRIDKFSAGGAFVQAWGWVLAMGRTRSRPAPAPAGRES